MAPIFAPIMASFSLAVDYLLVGGGATGWTGGGGGGGVKEGSAVLSAQPYSIVVGAAVPGNTNVQNGNPSSAFGDTAQGGGRGGGGNEAGQPGGSGGGGGYNSAQPGGAGTAGQGFAGGTAATNACGGGGGAGAVAANASANVGGAGGAAKFSSMSGASVQYGGGGGGGGNTTMGGGGAGGGGAAANVGGGYGVNGLGGGGGGIISSNVGGGGSGQDIIRYPGPAVKALGGDYVALVGTNIVHHFYNTGTFTPKVMSANGNDDYTKLLLHMDGTVGSTTFTDSSAAAHVPSSVAGVTIQVAGQAFPAFNEHGRCLAASGAGIFMDGSTDFAFGTGNFTIDFWLAIASFTVPSVNQLIFDFRPATTQGAYPTLYTQSGGILTYFANTTNLITGPALGLNTWQHIALTRHAGFTRMFVDGAQVGATATDNTNYLCPANRPVIFSSGYGVGTETNGYINEFRISKGIARWTSNFTRPAVPYS